jgi:hypothetical protein
MVSVANNPGFRRMIAGLRQRLQVQLQIISVGALAELHLILVENCADCWFVGF